MDGKGEVAGGKHTPAKRDRWKQREEQRRGETIEHNGGEKDSDKVNSHKIIIFI